MSALLDDALMTGMGALTLAVLLCAWRLLKGPSLVDRLLALDTLYVNAVALVIVMGMRWRSPLIFEVALLMAMLGFVSTVALSRFVTRGEVFE